MAEKDKGKEQEDEEIVMVGPGVDEEQETSGGDEDQEQEQEASGEEAEDERAGHAEHEEELTPERKAIRERRRQERRERREQYQRDQTELNFLRERNEALERRFSQVDARVSQSEVLAIDSRIAEVQRQLAQADEVIKLAINNKAGDDATAALKIKDELRDQLYQLQMAKAGVAQNIEETKKGGERGRPDPKAMAIKARAERWMQSHSDWFDPPTQGRVQSEDSFIAQAIEQRVWNEGRLDPLSDAYWQEVDRRIAKRLPHLGLEAPDRDDDGDRGGRQNGNRSARKAGGPRFATGGNRKLGKNEVYISPERIEALKAANAWEDPVLRAKYLRRYQQYDREHGVRH